MASTPTDQTRQKNGPTHDDSLATIERGCLISANIAIEWQGKDCTFIDWQYLVDIDPWRDHLPDEVTNLLPGKSVGKTVQHHFQPGELVGDHQADLVCDLAARQFHPPANAISPIIPAIGRFYPAEFFQNPAGICQAFNLPGRLIAANRSRLTVDFNHPLANNDINLLIQIDRVDRKPNTGHHDACKDIPSIVCDNGPGMQDRLEGSDTDFFLESSAFSRIDEGNDSEFFSPRYTPFWDDQALFQVSDSYNRRLPRHGKILDLMAGVHSPLQESDREPAKVVGAGLNRQELERNPMCTDHVVLDVNQVSRLPFDDESFDAVLIHAAIEYAIHPFQMIREASRILRPSGSIVISFSHRFLRDKAVRAWVNAHEFERPAIILSYLRSAGTFVNFECTSQRGLPRPRDDELAAELQFSDSVYIVSAQKRVDHIGKLSS